MALMNVMDVADFFISTANEGDPEEDDGITNMKLNKLLFFAQAASLQRFGKPLFDTPLEAWKYGPVVKDVYRTFKGYQRDSITKSPNHSTGKPSSPKCWNSYATYTALMRETIRQQA